MEFQVHSRQHFTIIRSFQLYQGILKYDVESILYVCFLMATRKPYLMSFISNLKEKKYKYFQ